MIFTSFSPYSSVLYSFFDHFSSNDFFIFIRLVWSVYVWIGKLTVHSPESPAIVARVNGGTNEAGCNTVVVVWRSVGEGAKILHWRHLLIGRERETLHELLRRSESSRGVGRRDGYVASRRRHDRGVCMQTNACSLKKEEFEKFKLQKQKKIKFLVNWAALFVSFIFFLEDRHFPATFSIFTTLGVSVTTSSLMSAALKMMYS